MKKKKKIILSQKVPTHNRLPNLKFGFKDHFFVLKDFSDVFLILINFGGDFIVFRATLEFFGRYNMYLGQHGDWSVGNDLGFECTPLF